MMREKTVPTARELPWRDSLQVGQRPERAMVVAPRSDETVDISPELKRRFPFGRAESVHVPKHALTHADPRPAVAGLDAIHRVRADLEPVISGGIVSILTRKA